MTAENVMKKTFTRQELYNLVWSEPMRDLAKKYEISDRGLAKACERTNVPVPERGYWNKIQAGKKVTKRDLPARGLGMSDQVAIGGNAWRSHYISHDDALALIIPPPPEFAENMESVRARVVDMVGRIQIPKTLKKPHRLILRLLDADEERRKKNLERYLSYDEPIFTTPFERRRLKILNSIFTAAEMCGMKPATDGKEARGLSVVVGEQWVRLTLDSGKADRQLERERQGYGFHPRGNDDPMILKISSGSDKSWKDTADSKIEDHLENIIQEIIIAGEARYRDNAVMNHEWLIKQKEAAEQEEIRLKKEAEKRHREELAKLEKQRVDSLLRQADNLDKATRIRNYVAAVRLTNSTLDSPLPSNQLEEWAGWALKQADAIDPIKLGQILHYDKEFNDENKNDASNKDEKKYTDQYDELETEKNWFRLMNSWPRKR